MNEMPATTDHGAITCGIDAGVATASAIVYEAVAAAPRMVAEKAAILALLSEAGVATASVEYRGDGDEGDTDEPVFSDAAGEVVEVNDAVSRRVKGFLQAVIDANALDYETGNGGNGEVIIEVSKREVRMDRGYNEVVTNYDYLSF